MTWEDWCLGCWCFIFFLSLMRSCLTWKFDFNDFKHEINSVLPVIALWFNVLLRYQILLVLFWIGDCKNGSTKLQRIGDEIVPATSILSCFFLPMPPRTHLQSSGNEPNSSWQAGLWPQMFRSLWAVVDLVWWHLCRKMCKLRRADPGFVLGPPSSMVNSLVARIFPIAM